MNLIKKIFVIFTLVFLVSLSISAINADNTTISNETNGGIRNVIINTNNDTIYLEEGIYSEINNTGLNVNRDLTIIGKNTNVIIDGENIRNIFTLSDNANIVLINITFNNSKGSVINSFDNPNGKVNDVSLINCNFYNNEATQGSAIYINGKSTILIDNCIFAKNKGTESGVFYFSGNMLININNSKFINNSARDYGAAFVSYNSNLTLINNCYFYNNTASGSGGAIFNRGGNLIINNSEFYYNNATGNFAYGGAIYHDGFNLTVIKSYFNGNYASYGGAIEVTSSRSKLNIYLSQFEKNTARFGGAVSVGEGSEVNIDNSLFSANYANSGGAMYLSSIFKAMINNSNFLDNSANRESGYGGAINSNKITIITNSSFENNQAYLGGAIYCYNLTVENGTFKNNTAQNNGGAINIGPDSYSLINNSRFINNKANNGGDVYISGNAFFPGEISIYYSNFTGGIARNRGGSIYNSDNLILKGNLINNASALLGSEIFNAYDGYSIKGVIKVLNLTYLNNSTITADIGEEIIIYTSLTDDMGNKITGRNISFFIDGQYITNVSVIEGHANITYSINQTGIFTINGNYTGINSFGIDIYPGKIKVINRNVILIAKDIIMHYKNGTQYLIKLTDSENNPLVNYTIYITVNTVTYKRITNSSGIASLNINLLPNNYTVNSSFLGDDNYNNMSINTSLEVLPTILASDLTKYFRNESQYDVKVLDKQGNPLKNSTVKFNINGVFYTRISNDEGIATLNINLNSGDYIITATDENGLNVSNIIKVLPILIGENLNMTVNNRLQYEVLVLDDVGNFIPNQTIVININGVFYYRTSDEDGVARLNINLDPGSYIATAMWKGYNTSNIITVNL